ncbi:MAG: hypothetical protein ACRCUG_05810 [Yersinia sp. (in: enterobacteria)]
MALTCTARLIETAGEKPVRALIKLNNRLINGLRCVNKYTFGYRRNRIMLKIIIMLIGVNLSLGEFFLFMTKLKYHVNRFTSQQK